MKRYNGIALVVCAIVMVAFALANPVVGFIGIVMMLKFDVLGHISNFLERTIFEEADDEPADDEEKVPAK